MANRERGEIAVTTFDGVEYTIAPSFNALCEVQGRLKEPLREVLSRCDQDDPVAIRAVLWSLLQRYHAAQFPTFESAGEWVDAVPGGAGRVITESFEANRDAKGTPANPLTAQAGIGERSSSAHAVPA